MRIGLTDAPDERKFHTNNVPLIGGIAVFLGFVFALLTVDTSLVNYRSLIAVSGMLVFIGILDDFHELTPKAKFVAQIFAGLLMVVWGHNQLHYLGNILFIHPLHLGATGVIISVIAVVGVINAFNMLDGVDGLAGGIGLITIILLSIISLHAGRAADLFILLVFASSLAGFLLFNFPLSHRKQANVFLGDAGSMLIGFIIVWFLVSFTQGEQVAARPVDMLWFVALPLYDVVSVVIQRLFQGRSPFAPDRNHFHHILLQILKKPLNVCLIMYSLSFIFGLIGILGAYNTLSEGGMFVGFVVTFICYLIIKHYLWKQTQKI